MSNANGQVSNNTTVSETSEKIPYNIPQTYTKEDENIAFHTEVIVDPKVFEDGLYYATATLQLFDYDKVYEALFNNKDDAKRDEDDYDGGKYVSYSSEDENLNFAKNAIIYLKPEIRYYNNCFSEYEDDYNANLYSTETEFAFEAKEKVWLDIKDKMKTIGLNIDGSYTCYALDYETMQKEEFAMGPTGEKDPTAYKPGWSEEDNGYYFIAHQELMNCVVQYPVEDVLEKVSEQNAPIKFLYTKDGLKMLDIENVFDFQVSDKYISLLPFEDIAKVVQEKYQMILSDTTYEVTRAELYLRPIKKDDNTYDVVPTWQFTIIDNESKSEGRTYINGITGEEIL
jgi:hypothetical protein